MNNLNIFKKVQNNAPRKNVFDLTHDVKMTGNFAKLMPTLVLECVPNDKFVISGDMLVRFHPMLAPIMHRVNATMHYFFVPNRIVWENWEDYITLNAVHDMPTIDIGASAMNPAGGLTTQERFLNYMGMPYNLNGETEDEVVNAIPFAAYQMIYQEYYRDQNMVADVNFALTDGDNTGNSDLYQQRFRAYEHDYFSACLPFAQKGAAVDIPLGEVELDPNWSASGDLPFFENTTGVRTGGSVDQDNSSPGGEFVTVGLSAQANAYDPNGSLQVQSTTINDLRRAMRLQEYLEKNARGGTRYSEWLRNHFNAKTMDARLNRPEYITGVKTPIITSEVLSTAGTFDPSSPSTPASPPTGNMAGHGVAVADGKYGSYRVHEHGYIIGIMSIMPKTAYFQGIPRTYLKRDPLDIYTPSFAHIGEQEVANRELYAYTLTGGDGFGYIPRFAEYKYMPSRVAGDFCTSLEYWHLGRKFGSQPALNSIFIEMSPDEAARIFAVLDGEQDPIYMHILHKIKAIRPMPIFGTPSF